MGFKHKTTTTETIEKAMADFAATYAEIAADIGVSGSAVSQWHKAGKMPVVASLALSHAMGSKTDQGAAPVPPDLVVIAAPSDASDQIVSVAKALGAVSATVLDISDLMKGK